MSRFDTLLKNVVIVVALIAAGFFAAWLRFAPHLRSGTWTDGESTYGGMQDDRLRLAVWEPGEPMPEALSSQAHESRPTESADGRFLVFSVGRPGLDADLWIAERAGDDGRWLAPQPLFELNTAHDEYSPAFGDDGLYFTSNRPGGNGGADIWLSSYEAGQFASPRALEAPFNSRYDDADPAPLRGTGAALLAFASRRPLDSSADKTANGDWNLWQVDSLEARAVPLAPLNSDSQEREPAFAAEGRALYFSSDRDPRDAPAGSTGKTSGGYDLFRSVAERGVWLPPEPLDALNTAGDERAPAPSSDGFELLYATGDASGDSDLWRARSRELFAKPGRTVGWMDLLVLAVLLALALLAYLAKRWERIDILYKCALVSLAAHLLLLWWFRDVYPEDDIVALGERGQTFSVRIASLSDAAETARARNSERNGEVQRERASELSAQVSEQERADLENFERSDAAAVAAEAREQIESDPAPLAAAPESAPQERSRATESVADVQAEAVPALSEGESFERDSSRAGDVALQGPSSTSRQRAATERAAPSRESAADTVPVKAASLAGPATLPVTSRQRVAADLPSAPSPRDLNQGRTAAAEVGLQVPDQPSFVDSESFEKRSVSSEQPDTGPLTAQSFQRSAPNRESIRQAPTGTAPGQFQPEQDVSTQKLQPLVGDFTRRQPTADLASAPKRRSLSAPSRAQTSSSSSELALRDEDLVPATPVTPTDSVASLSDPAATLTPLEPRALRSRTRSSQSAPQRYKPQSSQQAEPVVPKPEPAFEEIAAVAEPIPTPIERSTPSPSPSKPRTERTPFEETPYQARFGELKEEAIQKYGGDASTERAVERGLAYLARRQRSGGHWGGLGEDEKYGQVAIGKTGLVLLAFLGAGHYPGSGTEYDELTVKAVSFLLSVQDFTSGHFGSSSAYGHGIATYALAECYALTRSQRLRPALERAVSHILSKQERRPPGDLRSGGWSYYYSDERRFDQWPRVSISAWQIMALESAALGGIEIPDRVFDEARRFLLGSYDRRAGWMRYSHDPRRTNSNIPTLPGSTPAALFCLGLLGDDLEDEAFAPLWNFVGQRAPRKYWADNDESFARRGDGNLYFWYYGTLASFRRGGSTWQRWNTAMKGVLLGEQAPNGSWPVASVYARTYAGDTDADRVYSTAMSVLTLEVYYRYFTPLLTVK